MVLICFPCLSFMCCLAIFIYSLEKYLLRSFIHFFLGFLSFYYWIVGALYSLDTIPYKIFVLHMFPLFDVFSLSWWCPLKAQNFLILMKLFVFFILLLFYSCCYIWESFAKSRYWLFTPVFSPKTFIILTLTLRILIHFELSFIWCEVRIQLHSFPCRYTVVSILFCWFIYLSLCQCYTVMITIALS